jgi:hypothetical protein
VVFLAVLCAVPRLVGTNLASYTSALILVILILSLDVRPELQWPADDAP